MIDEHTREDVIKYFKERFPNPSKARILTFTSSNDGINCEYCDEVKQLAEELASLSEGRLILESYPFSDKEDSVKRLKIRRIPATVVTNENTEFAMKFYGLPAGYEFTALLEDIVDAARGTPRINEETKRSLLKLERPVHIQVFVTPTCPYCPRAVRLAHQFSMANPRLIDSEMIESLEFPELSEKYSVMAVPKIVINDAVEFEGALPETIFLYKVLEAHRLS